MKELEEKLTKLSFNFMIQGKMLTGKLTPFSIDVILKTVEDYFRKTGKQGGTTTHTRHPDHLRAIRKKGVEARRRKKV